MIMVPDLFECKDLFHVGVWIGIPSTRFIQMVCISMVFVRMLGHVCIYAGSWIGISSYDDDGYDEDDDV